MVTDPVGMSLETPMPAPLPALAIGRLLRPRSIAIVGASADPGSFGGRALAALRRFAYAGAVHLVNPKRGEIDGQLCVGSVDELPFGVDAAILAIPQAAIVEAVAGCVRRGVGAAVVFSSGFSETGEEGVAQQHAMTALARQAGIALVGPNCIGLVNYADGIPLTSGPVRPLDAQGRPALAVVSQSGGMMGCLIAACEAKGIPLSFAMSTGNEAVLGVEDLLADVVEHDGTVVIAVFAEQLRQPQRFLALAARARALGKAIVLLQSGRSERSREAAKSHTGAMASDHTTARTMLEDEAVILVDDLDELIDTAGMLTAIRRPPAAGTAIITDSGAFKGLALDFCEQIGLDLPELGADTAAALRRVLPSFAEPSNPLDVTGQAMRDMEAFYGASIRAMLADTNIGCALVALLMGAPHIVQAKIEAAAGVAQAGGKPVVVVLMGDTSPVPEAAVARLRDAGVPFFRSPSRALRAMAHVMHYGRLLERVAARRAVATLDDAMVAPPPGLLPEYVGKAWLAEAGLPVPDGGLATSVEEACALAATIGYPVVLKAQAAALTHKSDVGGVIVGLRDADAVRAAWQRMTASVGAARPDLTLDGILVERMGKAGLELVVGGRRDPQWGPVLMVGLGGVWVEVLKDVRFMPASVDAARVKEELRALKGAALLTGWRGAAPVDLDAAADAVVRIGRLFLDHPELLEIDVNPLVCLPEGEGVLALDALIVGTARDGD